MVQDKNVRVVSSMQQGAKLRLRQKRLELIFERLNRRLFGADTGGGHYKLFDTVIVLLQDMMGNNLARLQKSYGTNKG